MIQPSKPRKFTVAFVSYPKNNRTKPAQVKEITVTARNFKEARRKANRRLKTT